jgi:hypothetical protein
LNISNKEVDEAAKTKKGSQTKKTVSKKKVVYIQKYSSLNPEDWVEQRQAGCRMWVNPSTGEVAAECPWGESDPSSSSISVSPSFMVSSSVEEQELQAYAKDADDELAGTGSLVYSSKELEDMFSYLDAGLGSPGSSESRK